LGSINQTLLQKAVQAIRQVKLECIIIGNSASALQGAPVTTLDVDFAIRDTKQNAEKLLLLAKKLKGYLTQPFLPASQLYRIITNEIQLDFVVRMDGIRSFESLRSRAKEIPIGNIQILVASLEDVIKSKKACNRAKDKAVIPLLEQVLEVKKKL
jgi:hypothetical protein